MGSVRSRPITSGGQSFDAARRRGAGHCALTLITRTRDPLERSINACEQILSSMSASANRIRHRALLGIAAGD
jgi:hypothetical protein